MAEIPEPGVSLLSREATIIGSLDPSVRQSGVSTVLPDGFLAHLTRVVPQITLIFLNVERGLAVVILTRFFQHFPDLLLSDILIDGGGCGRFVAQHFLNGFQMLALVVQ